MQMKTEWLSKPSKRDHIYFALPSRLTVRSGTEADLFSISYRHKPLMLSGSQVTGKRFGERSSRTQGKLLVPLSAVSQNECSSKL